MALVVEKAMDVGSLVTVRFVRLSSTLNPNVITTNARKKLCGDPWLIENTFMRIPPLFCLCYG
jgi:hypothetical protein